MGVESHAPLAKKDYKSDQEVRWCPGCGDYSILSIVQGVFADLQISRHNTVVASGIGCSSRFPYYMSTYGFHTIHGRAPAIATGIKLANPELAVWLATGDGDALSIGGNHIIHLMRRNLNVKVMMFNNRIYGLTKGQYSPTSQIGKVSKSTPMGSCDRPFNPIGLALGSNASFVARSADTMPAHLAGVLKAAAAHKGTAFVEILQNCNIFNDGAWEHLLDRDVRDDQVVDLQPGKPVRFGKNLAKGLRLKGLDLEVFDVTPETLPTCIVWDPSMPNPAIAFMMAHLREGVDPTPIGIFRSVTEPVFEMEVEAQMTKAHSKLGDGDLEKLLFAGDLWDVV